MPASCMQFLFALPPPEVDELINSASNWPPLPDADIDPYDPRKQEYVRPASPEEVENNKANLLEQQIKKLETIIAKEKERPDLSGGKGKIQVVQHYEQILDEMRCSQKLVKPRTRSAPESEFEERQRTQDSNDPFAQFEELAMTGEQVEHEFPRVRLSIKASPGELLRQCSARGLDHPNISQVAPHSIQKLQSPPSGFGQNYTHARIRSQPNPGTPSCGYL